MMLLAEIRLADAQEMLKVILKEKTAKGIYGIFQESS
jgi:hypothetical protein